MFERSCHLPHHLSPSHFVYSMKNECNIHFPHTDTYTSWRDSTLLSTSHFCWKNNDWTWDCAVITRLRLERKIKGCTSCMAQQDDATTINDLQLAKCSSLFLYQWTLAKRAVPSLQKFIPSYRSFSYACSGHWRPKSVFLDVCIIHHYQFSLLSKNPFSCKRFSEWRGRGGRWGIRIRSWFCFFFIKKWQQPRLRRT